ncbi:DUF3775 domain-containing protein [Hyphococcus sp. DH-69]|uniref:DUF3775 domain-containing protein n=1 Tax=Hyphococcus formosus TaxID=3143534 RepID=UPI00398BA82B
MILDPDTACALIYKIRRLHGKEAAGPDVLVSNDIDEGQPNKMRMDDVLAEGQDTGNLAEIVGLLEGLESEQMQELAGLFLLGRDRDSYENLEAAKKASMDMNQPIIDLIRNDPASAEYLASGLEKENIRCDARIGAV